MAIPFNLLNSIVIEAKATDSCCSSDERHRSVKIFVSTNGVILWYLMVEQPQVLIDHVRLSTKQPSNSVTHLSNFEEVWGQKKTLSALLLDWDRKGQEAVKPHHGFYVNKTS